MMGKRTSKTYSPTLILRLNGTMLVPPFIGTRIGTVHNAACRQDKERVLCEVLGTSERVSNLQRNTMLYFVIFNL